MGRPWKRATRSSSSSNDNTTSGGSYWSRENEKLLVRYLTAYRDGAIGAYYGNNGETETFPTELLLLLSPIIIGGCHLPLLTAEAVQAPYLVFPSSLSSKHRRLVHETCVELDLFHCSMNADNDQRHVIVSIYADAFDSLQNVTEHSNSIIAMHKYRPWIFRAHRGTEHKGAFDCKKTAAVVRNVDALIDQPGNCLREDDRLDFFTSRDEDLSRIPAPVVGDGDGSWMLVNSVDSMQQCLEELHGISELAFDVEAYNKSNQAQMTCLLQLATHQRSYVIDVLAPGVWDAVMSGLKRYFEDPSIVKVGHSIGGLDTRCLYRDFGIVVVNAFDTYEASKVLGLEKRGLVDVCKNFGLVHGDRYQALKDEYQTCDWRVRPLTPDMIHYGRYDVHYLLPLRRLMMRDLARDEFLFRQPSSSSLEETMPKNDNVLSDLLRRMDQFEKDGFVENDDDDTFESARQVESSDTLDTQVDSAETFDTPCADATTSPESHPSMSVVHPLVNTVADAASLRLCSRLLTVISRSQERCKCLSVPNTNSDPQLNKLFQSRMLGKGWTLGHTELYLELARWRNDVAYGKLECLPEFVISLDFLVDVTWKLPTTIHGLKRITWQLPDVLSQDPHDEEYVWQLLSIVQSALERNVVTSTALPIYFWSRRRSKHKEIAAWWAIRIAVGMALVAIVVVKWRRR